VWYNIRNIRSKGGNMKRKGRPIEPDCVRRTGRRFVLWISQEDYQILVQKAKAAKVSRSEYIRRLIRGE
jgi:predicted HicB family RNase H-like nuclease